VDGGAVPTALMMPVQQMGWRKRRSPIPKVSGLPPWKVPSAKVTWFSKKAPLPVLQCPGEQGGLPKGIHLVELVVKLQRCMKSVELISLKSNLQPMFFARSIEELQKKHPRGCS